MPVNENGETPTRWSPRFGGKIEDAEVAGSASGRSIVRPVLVAIAATKVPYFIAKHFRDQSCTRRNRSAFDITDTEDKLIAAAAIMGESKSPSIG